MPIRALAVVVWALLAGTALGWLWLLLRHPPAAPAAGALPPASLLPPPADWARLLGADVPAAPVVAVAAPAPSPLRLVGVVAAAAGGAGGVALIAGADGPPRVFRVGAVVEGDTVLQSVAAGEARLGPRGGPAHTVLALPRMVALQGLQPGLPPAAPPADATADTSPIVPPYTDMAAPRASESGTPGSPWARQRERVQGAAEPAPR